MHPIQWNKKSSVFIILIIVIYLLLAIITLNYGYFWDNIQQISKEAHWFFQTNFQSLIMPAQNSSSEIVATGYHPPLMGIMTAILWKVFGYKLWVSHVFILFWALILFFNVWKLIRLIFEEKFAGWVLLIVLLEPTVLTQFAIASPDFILFTAFIISLRAILEKKPLLLSIALIFLCGINMRGIFVGVALFVSYFYYVYSQRNTKFSWRAFFKILQPYLPIVFLLVIYFVYYFNERGWFFTSNLEHYSTPTSVDKIIKHLAEFGLRTIENGRVVIWLIGFYIAFRLFKFKTKLSQEIKTLFLFWFLITGLYVIFVFITQMPFSARYFMPQFFVLTLLVLWGIVNFIQQKKQILIFVIILLFELTGNFWIYPDKIAKSWDCTLAHLPYYELRKDCFDFIDKQNIDYSKVSAGFCLYGDRKFVELNHAGKIVGDKPNRKFYIESNISNTEDSLAAAFKDVTKWKPVKRFQKGVVFLEIYEQVSNKNLMK